ncbi:MAG: class I SAM-dependent methyltransferase [Candidatus Thorarchaeota archaeon]
MDPNIDDNTNAVPFTARLLAHYRAEETKRKVPLIFDPFAERLAGDLSSYFKKHKRTKGTGDYGVVRTYYIDEKVLKPWCDSKKKSQIVILGAGLDARAYRFSPLKDGEHTVFEVDFNVVNQYKEEILKGEKPLCKLIRLSADLANPQWIYDLQENGYSRKLPTLWILEGLAYYLERNIVVSILQNATKNCVMGSRIFVDVCVPGLTEADFGPFMAHFKWGLNQHEVAEFFRKSGWTVTSSYADDHDQGRDVGQRGLIFVRGYSDPTKLELERPPIEKPPEDEVLRITDPALQEYASRFLKEITPTVHSLVELYQQSHEEGFKVYHKFVEEVRPSVQKIVRGFANILSVGHISSRLLTDPLTATIETPEEEEAHIVGYLKAVLYLAYCGIKGIEGEQFSNTRLNEDSQKIQQISEIPALIEAIDKEIG